MGRVGEGRESPPLVQDSRFWRRVPMSLRAVMVWQLSGLRSSCASPPANRMSTSKSLRTSIPVQDTCTFKLTSMLPRVAFEYGQISSAEWAICSARVRSSPGRNTLKRACSK